MDIPPASTETHTTDHLREQIRHELATMRTAFHALLATLTDADLQRLSANPTWTVKAVLVHIIASLAYVPQEIDAARRSKTLNPMPQWLYDRLNVWITRRSAAKQTRETIAQQYDAAYDATIRILETIQVHEWMKRTTFFTFEASIETIFRRQTQHFADHAAEIQDVIAHAYDG